MMKDEIKHARLIHADETPFICEEDHKKEGRTKNSKSYMWVYHTADVNVNIKMYESSEIKM